MGRLGYSNVSACHRCQAAKSLVQSPTSPRHGSPDVRKCHTCGLEETSEDMGQGPWVPTENHKAWTPPPPAPFFTKKLAVHSFLYLLLFVVSGLWFASR